MLQIRDFTKSRKAEAEYVKLSNKLRLCKSDDILIGRYGASVGKILTGLEGAYNVAIIKSIPVETIVKKEYIRRFFESATFQEILLKVCSSRTEQAGFSKDDIQDTTIPVPPLSEQQRIVAQLDEAFAEIDMIKAEAEKQLSDAKALFQKALSQAMTPKEGWEKKTLGEMAEVIHGKNQKEVQSSDGRYPIYGSGGNIMGYASDYLCEAGTTILGRKGSINNPIYINERFWNVDTAFGIAPKNGNISKFIYYFVRSIDWLEKNTGTTLPSLTQQVVKRVTMPAPPLSEQQRIAEELDELSENVREIEALNNKLKAECDAMKQALLRQVFE